MFVRLKRDATRKAAGRRGRSESGYSRTPRGKPVHPSPREPDATRNAAGPGGRSESGSGPDVAVAVDDPPELGPDPLQPLPQELVAPAEPDAQVPFQADVGARDDQRALLRPHPLSQLDAW